MQLVLACVVLGVGVGLVLTAGLGSDGYSSLVNGVARATSSPYAPVNWIIGALFIGLAWMRGVRPGPGTLVHPIVVGLSVNTILAWCPAPTAWLGKVVLLVAGAIVLAFGVNAYLAAHLGAGPFEAATLALHPVPFRLAYGILQGVGALVGWGLGADLGPGTVLIVVGVGPLVALFRRHTHWLTR